MEELEVIEKMLQDMIDEIAILMNSKKIKIGTIVEVKKMSRPKIARILNGEGKKEDVATVLEFCRNYKVEKNG